jgi:hypothetical protein
VPKIITEISSEFASRLQAFERSRVKMERLMVDSRINRRDINLFYEGILLRSVTSFEAMLEELFIGLLTGKITAPRAIHPRVNFQSTVVARKVVLGGRPYVDWLPYNLTKKRAEAFFRSGIPFTRLDNADERSLVRIVTIRNAVAHQSKAALQKFEREVIGSAALLASERNPAGYLRSVFRLTPRQTQYEDIANTLSYLAQKLCV